MHYLFVQKISVVNFDVIEKLKSFKKLPKAGKIFVCFHISPFQSKLEILKNVFCVICTMCALHNKQQNHLCASSLLKIV